MKKTYPALFEKESDGAYTVSFPDLKGCVTCGYDIYEAIEMAEEALGVYLAALVENSKQIPEPSDIKTLTANQGFVNYVHTRVDKYMKSSRSVKKTLTIPEWLNIAAEKAKINFFATLQDALQEKLAML